MYERTRSPSSGYNAGTGYTNTASKMASDIGPRKTMFVLVVVVGCFAILWPKVFYPMLVGSANQHIKPSPIDKTTGCCDVFSETDINTIKIMSELCSSIIQQSGDKPLSGKEIVARCKAEVQQTCGIDISAVLQEQFRLGRPVKQILNEIRSLNGSLCLKYNYGVAPWRLGVPHRISVNFVSNVRQERPPHMRPDIIHPAFRERGSAIPRPSASAKKPPKIVEGRPGPIPGMRPTLGGAGHVVPSSQKTGSSMSVIMPIYTIGIVIFFTYTLMKLLFKKQPDGVGGSLYPPAEPDPRFRREVFESDRCKFTPRLSRDPTGRIVVNAMSALLDEVNGEIEARRKANLYVNQPEKEHPSVKILGMETTASCEGGEKWNKPVDILIPVPHPPEPKSPPQEIYLQGSLPAQSQLLVSDAAIVTETDSTDINSDPAVVLAGKMTLSVISLDDKNQTIPSIAVQSPEIVDLNGVTESQEDDQLEESKYTTASSATVAEQEISENEDTDNAVVDGEEEEIERIEDLELEEDHVHDSALNGAASSLDSGEELAKEEAEEIEKQVEEMEEEVEEIEEEIEEIDVEDNFEQIERDEAPIKLEEGVEIEEEVINLEEEVKVPEEKLEVVRNVEEIPDRIGGVEVEEEDVAKEVLEDIGRLSDKGSEVIKLEDGIKETGEEEELTGKEKKIEEIKAPDEEIPVEIKEEVIAIEKKEEELRKGELEKEEDTLAQLEQIPVKDVVKIEDTKEVPPPEKTEQPKMQTSPLEELAKTDQEQTPKEDQTSTSESANVIQKEDKPKEDSTSKTVKPEKVQSNEEEIEADEEYEEEIEEVEVDDDDDVEEIEIEVDEDEEEEEQEEAANVVKNIKD
ncbi:Resistance to inhibitors of cholinesterase [Popillia japonica]|uniref:Resistance to inhibitors of cholinesterase n=1 Tax=Popillia japonica TaxID=7064 RepID=A0AAW1K2B1_POPJA